MIRKIIFSFCFFVGMYSIASAMQQQEERKEVKNPPQKPPIKFEDINFNPNGDKNKDKNKNKGGNR